MAAKKQQTHAKRARELAVKERRERKKAKKAERLAAAAEGLPMYGDEGGNWNVDGNENGDAAPEMPEDESAAGVAPVESG